MKVLKFYTLVALMIGLCIEFSMAQQNEPITATIEGHVFKPVRSLLRPT